MSHRTSRIVGVDPLRDFLPFPIYKDVGTEPSGGSSGWYEVLTGVYNYVQPAGNIVALGCTGRTALAKLFSRVRRWSADLSFTASVNGYSLTVATAYDLNVIDIDDERYLPHARPPFGTLTFAADPSPSGYPYIYSAEAKVTWTPVVAAAWNASSGVRCMIPNNTSANAGEVFETRPIGSGGANVESFPAITYFTDIDAYAMVPDCQINVVLEVSSGTFETMKWRPYGATSTETDFETVSQGTWSHEYLVGNTGYTRRILGDASSLSVTKFEVKPKVGPADTFFEYDGVYDGSDGSQLITPVPLTM